MFLKKSLNGVCKRLRWRSVSVDGGILKRSLSSDTDYEKDAQVPSYIKKFNQSISENVMVTVPLFLSVRNATWYCMVFVISQTVSVGPELGIAYMLTKVTAKFRQPVNVALAAAISSHFPVLRNVKASALFGALPTNPSDNPSTLGKVAQWISAPLDKYGFSYYLASKVSRFSSITGLTVSIMCGVDLSEALSSLGIGDSIQDTAGAMGAATLINVIILPVHLLFMTYALPVINSLWRTRKIG